MVGMAGALLLLAYVSNKAKDNNDIMIWLTTVVKIDKNAKQDKAQLTEPESQVGAQTKGSRGVQR